MPSSPPPSDTSLVLDGSAPFTSNMRDLATRRDVPVWGWRLISFVIVFGAWEIAGRIPISPAFPPFSATMFALWHLLASGELAGAYAQTLPPLVAGIVISSVAGVGLGIGMGLQRFQEWAFFPLLVILQTAPMAAIVPLITFVYGIGFTAKVASVVMLSMPIVAMNCYRGIREASPTLIEMTRSFMGTRRQIVFKIVLPNASGMIFAGLRLGVSSAFIGIVLAELLLTPSGVGDVISSYEAIGRYPEMFAAIFSIICLATLTLTSVQILERHLFAAFGQGGFSR
jgi:ABC-type nitrate/sulfonate/bicarbonate transport system permease component